MRWLLLATLLSACGTAATELPGGEPLVDVPEVTEPSGELLEGALQCDTSQLRVSSIHPWPGGGLQLLISSVDTDTLAVGSISASPWPIATSPIQGGSGLTGLALYGSPDAATLKTRIAEATAFIEKLPGTEKIVLWHVGETTDLMADTTRNKQHIIDRLSALTPQQASPSGLWQRDLAQALANLGDPYETVHRSLVLVGTEAEESPLPLRRPVEVCVAESGSTLCADGKDYEASRKHTLRIGVCPPYPIESMLLRVGPNLCQVPIGEFPASGGPSCDPGHAAIDHYPYGKEIRIELEPDQKKRYDEYHAAQSQEEFIGTVTLGDHAPQSASLHFRGATSMHCARKSFKVNLEGNDVRRFLPGGSGDEFYLISLCKDDRYFNQVFANRLLKEMHQFPLGGRYVRLKVNGSNLGVYYLLEHVKEKLLVEHVDLSALVRRRFDPHDKPEDIKYPDDAEGIAKAQSAYDMVAEIALGDAPETLVESLEERIDMTRYLRWLAFNTFMRNGDTIDEAFFFASQEAGSPYFRHMGWDADDLFSDCHHFSEYALVDPHELIYCAEGNLDKALLRSTALYDRYVSTLEELLLTELSPEYLQAVMDDIEVDLWSVLTNDPTAQGLKELLASNPDADTAEAARADIRAHMKAMLSEAETRRALLLDRIALYRGDQ